MKQKSGWESCYDLFQDHDHDVYICHLTDTC